MSSLPKVLITGAAGYIGSITAAEMALRGYPVVGVDSFERGYRSAEAAVRKLAPASDFKLFVLDIADSSALRDLLRIEQVDVVVHFAGYKQVAESNAQPDLYYQKNVENSMRLVRSMQDVGVHRLVYSSSCTVYGASSSMVVDETSPTTPINPYGRTKLMVEHYLSDVSKVSDLTALSLRYFNPIGAHPSGLLGDHSWRNAQALLPSIVRVAAGYEDHLTINGGDYPTEDGTCVRDYIHVMDVASAHIAAVELLGPAGRDVLPHSWLNIGTGTPYSVREIVRAFEMTTGQHIPIRLSYRRAGDAPSICADTKLAASELNWAAELELEQMCVDHWNHFQVTESELSSGISEDDSTEILSPRS